MNVVFLERDCLRLSNFQLNSSRALNHELLMHRYEWFRGGISPIGETQIKIECLSEGISETMLTVEIRCYVKY